jgi:hypothetical protein
MRHAPISMRSLNGAARRDPFHERRPWWIHREVTMRALKVAALLLLAALSLFWIAGCGGDDGGSPSNRAPEIDQSNLPEWGGGWTHVNPTAEDHAFMWQTFMPERPNLTTVEIGIMTANAGFGDDVLTVEIAEDGNVLASAQSSVEDGFEGVVRFDFEEPVPLVPEQTYELRVRDTGRTTFGWKYSTDTYERGVRYASSEEKPGTDWFFQTYSEVE